MLIPVKRNFWAAQRRNVGQLKGDTLARKQFCFHVETIEIIASECGQQDAADLVKCGGSVPLGKSDPGVLVKSDPGFGSGNPAR